MSNPEPNTHGYYASLDQLIIDGRAWMAPEIYSRLGDPPSFFGDWGGNKAIGRSSTRISSETKGSSAESSAESNASSAESNAEPNTNSNAEQNASNFRSNTDFNVESIAGLNTRSYTRTNTDSNPESHSIPNQTLHRRVLRIKKPTNSKTNTSQQPTREHNNNIEQWL